MCQILCLHAMHLYISYGDTYFSFTLCACLKKSFVLYNNYSSFQTLWMRRSSSKFVDTLSLYIRLLAIFSYWVEKYHYSPGGQSCRKYYLSDSCHWCGSPISHHSPCAGVHIGRWRQQSATRQKSATPTTTKQVALLRSRLCWLLFRLWARHFKTDTASKA